MSDGFDQIDFLQALDAKNWTSTDRLHTPTLEAILHAEVLTLVFPDGISQQLVRGDVEALTRFLVQYAHVEPLVPPVDDSSLFPRAKRVLGPVQEDEIDDEEYLPARQFEESGDYNEFVKE